MGKKGGDQQVVTKTELDPATQRFLTDYRNRATGVADDIARRGGYQLPGASPLTGQAINIMQGLGNQPGLQGAMGGANQLAQGLGLGMQTGLEGIERFYNPYENQVIGAAQQDFANQRDLASQAADDYATRSGAFGGSRGEVYKANLMKDINQGENQLLSTLRNQGFQNAMTQLMGERGMQLGAGLQGTQLQAQLGQVGANIDAMRAQGLQGLGDYQRNVQQQQFMWPILAQQQALAAMGSGLGFGGQTSTQTVPGSGGNPFGSALGGGMAGASFGPWGAGIGAGLGFLGGLFG